MIVDTSEKGLKIFINDLLIDMKHRKYKSVEEKITCYEDSFIDLPSFFDLIHLKIRSIFKQIRDMLNWKNDLLKYSTYHIDKYVLKSIEQLNYLTFVSNSNCLKQLEIITGLYLELSYITSMISKRKNEGYNSLAFNCYAMNIMKLFLQRVPYPSEIRTYYYYQQNILLVSKQLIDDNNYETAKQYQFNCLQVTIQALSLISKETTDLLYSSYYNRLMEGLVIALIHRGVCEENMMNNKQALEAYKQAKYFSSFLNIIKEDMFLFNLCDKLFQLAFGLFGDTMIQHVPQMNPTQDQTPNEQDDNMFSICNGFTCNISHLKQKEEELNKKVFNKANNDKDILLRFVDDHFKEYRRFSPESKSNLAHYSLYNKLLSPKYKEYVAMTKNFEYYHPSKQKENIESIEKYINSKIDVKNNNENEDNKTFTQIRNKSKRNSIKSNTKANSNSNTNTNTKGNITNPKSRSKYLSTSPSFFSSNTYTQYTNKSPNPCSFIYQDRPVTKEERYILSKNFKGKLSHIDSLSEKELEFQKLMLRVKRMNCPKPKLEIKDLNDVRQEVYQTFNLLKIKTKTPKKENRENLIKKMISNINCISLINKTQTGLIGIGQSSNNNANRSPINNDNRRTYLKKTNGDKLSQLNREIEDLDHNIRIYSNKNNNKSKKALKSFLSP